MDKSEKVDAMLRFNIYFKYINSKIDELEKALLKERDSDLTQREFSYVALIGNYPELSYSELIDLESISKSTFSNQIKLLESKGLVVQKGSGDDDKRKKFLALTEEGRKVFDIYKDIRKFFYDNYLSNLDDKEKNELFRIGEKMANKMRELTKNKSIFKRKK